MTDFPVPGPPATMNADALLVLAGASNGIEDRVVGDELLVEQREDGLVSDDAGDVVEQSLVRSKRRVRDAVEDRSVVRAGDAFVEIGREVVDLVAGEGRVRREQPRELRVEQRRLLVVRREMQIRASVERDGAVGERRVGVEQVALVLGDLARRMQVVDLVAAEGRDDAVGDVRPADVGPLLQLDDDRGIDRLAGWIR